MRPIEAISSKAEGKCVFECGSYTDDDYSPASENQPTSKEQLQLDTEHDGTVFAEQAQEKQRNDQENWARYTEEVEKGSGNKMANVG